MGVWALKEWATACEALADGRQSLLVRKGGIDEKAFALPADRFLLLPSYAHQQPELLKPEVRVTCRRQLTEFDATQPVMISHWVELAHVWEVADDAVLQALSPYHIWADSYAESRLRWRPKHPLLVLLARVHALPKPFPVPPEVDLGGCRSWFELPYREGLLTGSPVVDDATFEAWLAQLDAAVLPYVSSGAAAA